MKRTFVMAVAVLFSTATMAQTGTRKMTKDKMQKDSMQQMMGKDSLYTGSDSTMNGKYKMNKKNKMKMKSKTKMPIDSTSTMK
jgi:hypothetical protein